MPIFKVQQVEADTCGNHWTEVEPWYVEAEDEDQVAVRLSLLPAGLFHWDVQEINVVHFSHIEIRHKKR